MHQIYRFLNVRANNISISNIYNNFVSILFKYVFWNLVIMVFQIKMH